jgi:hypothetical protein
MYLAVLLKYSTLTTAVADVFYLCVQTGNMFRSTGIIMDPAELLYAS